METKILVVDMAFKNKLRFHNYNPSGLKELELWRETKNSSSLSEEFEVLGKFQQNFY